MENRIICVPYYMCKEDLNSLGIRVDATVEAEYGEKVLEGDKVTLAHHVEKYKNCNAPCNRKVEKLKSGENIIVSHMDLDTIGGCLALLGLKPEDKEFWKGAEFIDIKGNHHIKELSKEVQDKINAYSAFNSKLEKINQRKITDVTERLLLYKNVLEKIINNDKELINEGRRWTQEILEKIEKCLIYEDENIRIFKSRDNIFCSAAYYSEAKKKIIPTTLTYNMVTKSITLAFEDGGKKYSAKEIVQNLWGDKAGGHRGIAGSPRGVEMSEEDFENIKKYLKEKLY